MECTSPIPAYWYLRFDPATRKSDRALRFKPGDPSDEPTFINCRRCFSCRMSKAREWSVRAHHEALVHEHNCYLTLSYEHEPMHGSLAPEDFTRFMKRLRKRLDKRIRYLMCGEYGAVYDENNRVIDGALGRPHFHCILFGHDFPDREYWGDSKGGYPLYRSAELELAWTGGHSWVQDFTKETANYVAQYTLKKITGPEQEDRYKKFNINTGEIVQVHPEYGRMSRNPGLGADFFDRWTDDLYNKDYITIDGVKHKVPEYYDQLLKRVDPDRLAEVKKNVSNTQDGNPWYPISVLKQLISSGEKTPSDD